MGMPGREKLRKMQNKRVLVVEDNALNRELLCHILSQKYQVLEAENGAQALEILRAHPGDISLIFLDVVMPVMDGYTFLAHLRTDSSLSFIPVIITTQGNSEEDELNALSHGATDFVPKPYRPKIILHRAANLIELQENAAMVNQFKYDRLTGLYSREYFYQKVAERLAEDPDTPYAIVCSNVENFKVYNDIFGTKAGDRVLKNIAEAGRALTGEDGLCARYGADRFLYLQKQEALSGYLRQDSFLNKLVNVKDISLKWGVYKITAPSVPVEKMCDRAFLVADSIKGRYNQTVAVYDDVLRDKLLREQAITESMETALAEGQFAVYLQPKYWLKGSTLSGAEALARWIHPELGFLSPAEFIPLFEKNGFITQLDRYVWEQTCKLLRRWRQEGDPAIPVSVNVSRADVYQDDLPETLTNLVERYGIEPQQFHLELTESAYTENPNQIITMVDELRRRGFVIEMDDFGSGYSSLNMLSQVHFDILKLDMKFIQTETAKPGEMSIMRFVVNLAKWLNLSTVAEGAETKAQVERLQDVGCDYAQGYYFSRPLPIPEFEALLKKERMLPHPQGETPVGV